MIAVAAKRERETRRALDIVAVAERDAWGAYLQTCRSEDAAWYEEVEPHAWARLQRRLATIRARRAELERRTA